MICLPLPHGFLCRIWTTTRMCYCTPSHDMPVTAWWISAESGLQPLRAAVLYLMICLTLPDGSLQNLDYNPYVLLSSIHDRPATAWWISVKNLNYNMYVLVSSISGYACHCLMDFCEESELQHVCAGVLHLMIWLPLPDCFLWRIRTTTRMCCCTPSHDMPATAWWISVQNLDYNSYALLSSTLWYTCHCLVDFCEESELQLICAAVIHLMICLPLPDGFLYQIWTRACMCWCPPSHDMPATAWWISLQNLDYNMYVLVSSISWYTCHWLMDFCTE